MESYHPFVNAFHSFFKRYRFRDDNMIRSYGTLLFDDDITVEENIHEHDYLKYSAESTNAILVTIRQNIVYS